VKNPAKLAFLVSLGVSGEAQHRSGGAIPLEGRSKGRGSFDEKKSQHGGEDLLLRTWGGREFHFIGRAWKKTTWGEKKASPTLGSNLPKEILGEKRGPRWVGG